jgi:hypothetical protein
MKCEIQNSAWEAGAYSYRPDDSCSEGWISFVMSSWHGLLPSLRLFVCFILFVVRYHRMSIALRINVLITTVWTLLHDIHMNRKRSPSFSECLTMLSWGCDGPQLCRAERLQPAVMWKHDEKVDRRMISRENTIDSFPFFVYQVSNGSGGQMCHSRTICPLRAVPESLLRQIRGLLSAFSRSRCLSFSNWAENIRPVVHFPLLCSTKVNLFSLK